MTLAQMVSAMIGVIVGTVLTDTTRDYVAGMVIGYACLLIVAAIREYMRRANAL